MIYIGTWWFISDNKSICFYVFADWRSGSAAGSDPAGIGSNPVSAIFGSSPNGKAQDFDSCIWGFESLWPSFRHMAQLDSARSYELRGFRFESEYVGFQLSG